MLSTDRSMWHIYIMGSETFLMTIIAKSHFNSKESDGSCRPVEAMVFLTVASQRVLRVAWVEEEMKYGQGLFLLQPKPQTYGWMKDFGSLSNINCYHLDSETLECLSQVLFNRNITCL